MLAIAGGAQHDVAALGLVETLDVRGARRQRDGIGVGDAADPLVALRVELRLARQERLVEHLGVDEMHQRAVLGRDIVGIIQSHEAARAGHRLHDEVGLAGDVLAHVPGGELGVEPVSAAHSGADENAHVLAREERLRRLRAHGRKRRGGNGRNHHGCGSDAFLVHCKAL